MEIIEIIINNTAGGPLLPKFVECAICRKPARVDGRKNCCYRKPFEHSLQTAKCAACGTIHLVFNVLERSHLAAMQVCVEEHLSTLRYDDELDVWVRDGFVSP